MSSLPDGQLLPPDWRLDNLYEARSKLVPKDVDDYNVTYFFDSDGDGTFEIKERRHAYELRFEHLRTSGVIWLRVVPVSRTDALREPRVLAHRYIQGIAGAGYEVTTLSGATIVTREKRYAAEILEEYEGTFAGGPAYSATLDVANVDQVQVVQSDRVRRVRFVLGRPQILHELRWGSGADKGTKGFPAALVAGYSSLPEDFEKSLPASRGLHCASQREGPRWRGTARG